MFVLCLHLATIFVTTQYDVSSNTVLRILRHVHFTEEFFEPIIFLPIFDLFVLDWSLQEQVYFEVDICKSLTMIRETCNFPLINQLFGILLDPLKKQVEDYIVIYSWGLYIYLALSLNSALRRK